MAATFKEFKYNEARAERLEIIASDSGLRSRTSGKIKTQLWADPEKLFRILVLIVNVGKLTKTAIWKDNGKPRLNPISYGFKWIFPKLFETIGELIRETNGLKI